MDWSAPGRLDTFKAVMVSTSDLNNELGSLHMTEGSVFRRYYSETKTGGTITVSENPGRNLVRIYVESELGGESERMVLGTFFPRWDSVDSSFGLDTYELSLESTLVRLSEDMTPYALSYPAGTVAWSAAKSIMKDCLMQYKEGLGTYASSKTTATVSFDAGTSWLTVINGLLTAVGLSSLSVDARGYAFTEPYVSPESRRVAYEFTRENCVYAPGLSRSTTEGDIPNRVIVTATIDGNDVATVRDLPSSSPYSAKARGRRKSEMYSCDDVDTKAALDAKADLYFRAIASYVETESIEHTYAPVSEGDVVRLMYGDGGTTRDSLCMVQDMEIKLESGMTTNTKLSVIRWIGETNG